MMKVWDYFMRRKGLLLLFLVFFMLGGIFSYQVLRSSAIESAPKPTEYIHVDYLGRAETSEESEIEIPNTGGEVTISPVILGILQPHEVIALAPVAEDLQEPSLPANTDAAVQQTIDLSTVQPAANQDSDHQVAAAPNFAYLVFLSITGLVVAGLGVYLLEQHFLR